MCVSEWARVRAVNGKKEKKTSNPHAVLNQNITESLGQLTHGLQINNQDLQSEHSVCVYQGPKSGGIKINGFLSDTKRTPSTWNQSQISRCKNVSVSFHLYTPQQI